MKEGFIKIYGQDKPQKMFYEPKQKANNKTLADMPKIQQFCFVFVALRPKSTAMVIAGRSVHLTTLFPGQA